MLDLIFFYRSKKGKGRPGKVEVFPGLIDKNLPASSVLSAPNVKNDTNTSDRVDPHADLMAEMLNSSLGNTAVNSFNPMFSLDLLVMLTVKATQTKTIHITEFFPEHIRKKRFPKSYRVDAKEGGEPCVLY